MRRLSYAFGLGFAAASHLAVVPIMSLYGTQICPVLGDRGFGFGCAYNLAYVAFVFALNTGLTGAVFLGLRTLARRNARAISLFRAFPVLAMATHLAAFATGSFLLTKYFRSIGVPGVSIELMSQALLYTTLLLSVLQANIMDWLTQVWISAHGNAAGAGQGRVTLRWVADGAWNAIPILCVFAIAGGFVFARLNGLVESEEISDEAIYSLFSETIVVFALLLGWLGVVRLFSFLKQNLLIEAFRRHLEAVSRLDATYRSVAIAPGFWASVFAALNRASEIIEQRAKLIRGFSAYVTQTVAERILNAGELKPEGELRDLTILVSDLRDFTRLSSSLPAEKVVQMLNVYFADMIDVLIGHGIVLDKFIGDGILAYVDPDSTAKEPHERIAVRAARAMHERVEETNRKLAAQGLPSLKLGVAVHKGPVILGSIGAPQKMQHTIIGDPVNVTARLEGLCKEFKTGIIVSDRVHQALGSDAGGFKDLGEQPIRGLSASLRIFADAPSGAGASAA